MIKILRIYKDLNFFLGKKIANRLIYLLVILLISSIVEMATLSLFPIYISLLLDKGNIQEIMGYDLNNINFFMPLSSTLLNFSLILIICLFFKIIFVLFTYYYELTTMKKIKSSASDKLYANYINRSFSYFININSSIIYRVIIQDVNEAAAYISSTTTLVREFFILTIITSLLLIYNTEVALISIIVFSLLGSIFYFSTTFALKKNALIRVAAAKKKNLYGF